MLSRLSAEQLCDISVFMAEPLINLDINSRRIRFPEIQTNGAIDFGEEEDEDGCNAMIIFHNSK